MDQAFQVICQTLLVLPTQAYETREHIETLNLCNMYVGDSGFFQTSRYQGIVKATVFGVFEDPKFKISEGSDQN